MENPNALVRDSRTCSLQVQASKLPEISIERGDHSSERQCGWIIHYRRWGAVYAGFAEFCEAVQYGTSKTARPSLTIDRRLGEPLSPYYYVVPRIPPWTAFHLVY